MANLLLLLGLFGFVTLATANIDCSSAEWTGKDWLGKWKSTDQQENYAQLFEVMGRPVPASPPHIIQEYWKVGDDYHHRITVPYMNFTEEFQFKLAAGDVKGVRYVSAKPDGTSRAWEYQEKDGKLVSDITVNGLSRHVEVSVNGDDYNDTVKVGEVVAKRLFRKTKSHCESSSA